MEEFLNKKLAVGDHVVLIKPHYREFLFGKVTGFTEKNVRVECVVRGHSEQELVKFIRDPKTVVKVTEADALWKLMTEK